MCSKNIMNSNIFVSRIWIMLAEVFIPAIKFRLDPRIINVNFHDYVLSTSKILCISRISVLAYFNPYKADAPIAALFLRNVVVLHFG